MDLRLLGPIEATVDGRPIVLGTTKQRSVLAMLALRANHTVSVDRLAEGLWGEHPPDSAPKMVQLYVSHLRKVLAGDGAEIVTRGRGYELRVVPDAVDTERFEQLVAAAARGGPNGAAREALALWRGDALADLAGEPFAAAEIRRLKELRLRATELAVDADLDAGRHAELIGELEALVAAHPLQERLHAQRMVALYRSGRQAEALEAYRSARRILVEEIGVEPNAELRRLQDAVLRQDRSLDLPAVEPQPGSGDAAGDAGLTQAARSPEAGRAVASAAQLALGRRALIVGALLVIVAGLAVFAVTRWTGPDTLEGIDENAVGVIDAHTGRVTTQYVVGRGPSALTVGGGSVWAANAYEGTVSRIDREHHRIVTIPVGDDPGGVAFAAGSLWVTNPQQQTVSQIDPDANRVIQRVEVGVGPHGVAAGFGAVWVASEADRTVARIDIARGGAARRIDVAANPTAIAAGAGALWVVSEEGGTVFRLDPRSGAVLKAITVGNGPVGVAVGEGAVWVANRQDETVSRIDPATDSVTDTLRVGHAPSAIAVGEGAVWVANSGDGTVSRIDPARRELVDTIEVKSSPTALAVADGSVWTAALASPASHRGGTLRVESSPLGWDHLEPGTYDAPVGQLLSLAYDGLVAYRRAGGATFGTLVGDLAMDVPEPSADGRTYVFRLRPNVRFSNGAAVQPEDFRASLEDLLRRFGSGVLPLYGAIAGAPACVRTPRQCDLSRGIVTSASSRTITVHLTEPDSEFLHRLASAFAYVAPADHPFGPKGEPPGTGPYRIASYDPDRALRLVRNRDFRVWSQDARPDGFADAIVVRFRKDIRAQVTAVQRAAADVVVVASLFGGGIPPASVPALARRHAGRLHTDAVPELDFMWMNVRTPPFDDVRVRRAINYATDRRAIAELAGGVDLAQSTCQFVPPGFPGYAPSCRYTLNPGPGGSWTAPDLQRARRLIDQSHTKGTRVTVWSYGTKREIGRYFATLLHRLGYPSSLRVFRDYGEYRSAVTASRTRAKIGIDGWSADYSAPSTFTAPFTCAGSTPRSPDMSNLAEFCDRRIDARIDAALAARGPATNARWQDAYDRLADAAPAVPLLNRRTVALVSKRVGNYQHHPLFGPLLDQLWVR
jgi:YVTN family beta-propeller protein